jgi:hypothetical protein
MIVEAKSTKPRKVAEGLRKERSESPVVKSSRVDPTQTTSGKSVFGALITCGWAFRLLHLAENGSWKKGPGCLRIDDLEPTRSIVPR